MPYALQAALDAEPGCFERISTDGRFAAVDVVGRHYQRHAVIVDLRENKWSVIDRTAAARIDPCGTGKLALMLNGGSIVEKHMGGGRSVLLARTSTARGWDYSFDDGRLYVIENGYRLSIFTNGRLESRKRISVLWQCRRVRWQRVPRELWVGADGMLDQFANLVFSPTGGYLGGLSNRSSQVFVPLAINSEIEGRICSLSKRRKWR